MNPIHAWVDPEEIRKLAARLMTPYEGYAPPQAIVAPEPPPRPIVEEVSPPEASEPSALPSPTATAATPFGQSHPVRVALRQMLPEASAFGFGADGEIAFDDGNLAHLRFLAVPTGAPSGAATDVVSWASLTLQAGQSILLGTRSSAAGKVGMVISTREMLSCETRQAMDALLREL